MLRVVFDTNILFSATGWRGSPYQCLTFARQGKFTLILCHEILIEYHEKLQTKLGMTPVQATRAVAEILLCTTLIDIKNELRLVKDDPDDDKVIECAVAGNAAYVVSGDQHLISLKEFQGISIIRASEFLTLVIANSE